MVQSDKPPSPLLWLRYFTAAFLFTWAILSSPAAPQALSRKTEWALFLLLFSFAAFFRIYRLGSLPPGLFIDQGFMGWSALRILHEGFRPMWEFNVFQNPALLLYQLAGWFFFVPAGRFTFYLFFALMSLATLPLVYGTFRQLSGPRTALCAMFFLAVMRWNVNFSRNGFPTIQVPFYIFGTLAFLLLGLRTGKRWPFYLSACFFGLGFYTYQAYKAFPLWLFLLGLYAVIRNRQALLLHWKKGLGFLAVSVLVTLPFLWHTLAQRSLGSREASVSIFSKVKEFNSWSPLWENLQKTALMFHWQGDPLSRHNLPLHRMLDDGTGILFFFGLVMALLSPWKKISYFALTGLGVLALPGVLSIDSAHANRLLGLTPLVALLAALPLAALWEQGAESGRKWLYLLAAGLGLSWIAWQNFDLYFHQQASDMDAYEQYDSEETIVGQKTGQYGGDFDLYFAPAYFPLDTLRFLSYDHRDRIHVMRVPEDLACPREPNGLGKGFFLEPDRKGLYALLKRLYPGGMVENFINPAGEVALRLYRVPPGELAKKKGLSPGQLVPRGLKGFYYDDPATPRPSLVHNDPLLNFPSLGAFYRRAPLIDWTGVLEAPRTGAYGFGISTWSQASLFLDGKECVNSISATERGQCFLTAGPHKIEVVFLNPGGREFWFLDLYWKKPGTKKEEIIPNEAFGVIK
jgi:hypothetical protein